MQERFKFMVNGKSCTVTVQGTEEAVNHIADAIQVKKDFDAMTLERAGKDVGLALSFLGQFAKADQVVKEDNPQTEN